MDAPKPHLKYKLARRFRQQLTPPEARLWVRIKGKPDGIHFRRQHPIGRYIVDFYCAEARLVIEVEGQIHSLPSVEARDDNRLAWLETQGVEVLRLQAIDIMADPDETALGVVLRAREIISGR